MRTLTQRCQNALTCARSGTPVLLILSKEEIVPAFKLVGVNAATVYGSDPLGHFSNNGRAEARVVLCLPTEAQTLLSPQRKRK